MKLKKGEGERFNEPDNRKVKPNKKINNYD